MRQKQIVIRNKLGLHARAAAKVVHEASRFTSEITLGTDGEQVNAKSILGILTLAATRGSSVIIRAEGRDEEAAVDALGALIDDKFGEPE